MAVGDHVEPMSAEKFKAAAEGSKAIMDIIFAVLDRFERKRAERDAQAKRIAELEAQLEKLRSS